MEAIVQRKFPRLYEQYQFFRSLSPDVRRGGVEETSLRILAVVASARHQSALNIVENITQLMKEIPFRDITIELQAQTQKYIEMLARFRLSDIDFFLDTALDASARLTIHSMTKDKKETKYPGLIDADMRYLLSSEAILGIYTLLLELYRQYIETGSPRITSLVTINAVTLYLAASNCEKALKKVPDLEVSRKNVLTAAHALRVVTINHLERSVRQTREMTYAQVILKEGDKVTREKFVHDASEIMDTADEDTDDEGAEVDAETYATKIFGAAKKKPIHADYIDVDVLSSA